MNMAFMNKSFISCTFAVFMLSVFSFESIAASGKESEQNEPVAIRAEINKSEPVYSLNEEIIFTAWVVDSNPEPVVKTLTCDLCINGKSIEKKSVLYGEKCVFKLKLDKPGWVAIKAVASDDSGKLIQKKYPRNQFDKFLIGGIGAMVAPDKLKAASGEPADFMEFWQRQRAELDKIPITAEKKQVKVPEKYCARVKCYEIKVNCAGGMPVSGYLTIPLNAAPKSLPAIVYFDGAGIRSATQPVWYRNAIAFHINAHGIDNGKSAEYYAALNKGRLHDYKYQGKTSRDTFYFKGMLLRAMRALDYLKTLPEWDGKNLISFGGSMGGGQAIAAAGLDPQVTACLAIIPALGDLNGELAGRLAAYPQVVNLKNGESEKPVIDTVRYFDTVNFARHIKCKTILSTGLIDFTCPPSSVYLIYNSLSNSIDRKIITYPRSGHKYQTPPEMEAILRTVW